MNEIGFEERIAKMTSTELRRFITKIIDLWGKQRYTDGMNKAVKPAVGVIKYGTNGGSRKFIFPNCTLRDRLLLHMLENIYSEKPNPKIFSRYTIAEATGVVPSQVSRIARKLIARGDIIKKRLYMPETGKFRDIYELTDSGTHLAMEIKDRLENCV